MPSSTNCDPVAWSFDNQLLAVGGCDGIATILAAQSGKIVSETEYNGKVASIKWSKDAKHIAIGTEPEEACNSTALIEPLMSEIVFSETLP